MTKETLVEQLQLFMKNEAKSCSKDFGCITPLSVYRMWGGKVPLEEIERAMQEMAAYTIKKGMAVLSVLLDALESLVFV